MNKYEQAYQNIQVDLPTNNKDILVLRELVDLATPKKPICKEYIEPEIDGNGAYVGAIFSYQWKCPVCGAVVAFSEPDSDEPTGEPDLYCRDCGQRLDWGKEDD